MRFSIVEIYTLVGLVGYCYGTRDYENEIFINGTLNAEVKGDIDISGRIRALERVVKRLESSFQHMNARTYVPLQEKLERQTRQANNFIGFTAYLDHVIDHLGINQVIVYDKLLLNAGGAYNSKTGHFTCPTAGYYAFSYYIYTNGIQQIVARLVVDGVNEVDGISDTYHEHHEAQGGNFVVLYLRVGQVVAVQNYRWADKAVDSSSSSRMASFSGFLIWPTLG